MAGYVYKGKDTIAKEQALEACESPLNTRGTPRKRRAFAVCGTPAGYQKHLRESTDPCRDCKDAIADQQARRRGSTRRYDTDQPEHGTNAGWQRHRRKGERPCFECSEGRRLWQVEYRRKRAAAAGLPLRTLAALRADTEARITELEHLISAGTDPEQAVLRAGWPTVSAASRALYRRGHPLANALEQARRNAA